MIHFWRMIQWVVTRERWIALVLLGLILVLLSWFVLESTVNAAVLECDPQPGITYYVVLVNDVPQRVEAQEDGSLKMEITDSAAIYKAAACNKWECSHTVTVVPGVPNRMRMR